MRRVFSCQVRQIESDRIRLDISGNGFLWNMVRIIAGTLLQVGIGQRAPDDVRRILEGRDRTKAGPTVPGTGLCLEWIRYGGAYFMIDPLHYYRLEDYCLRPFKNDFRKITRSAHSIFFRL